MKLTHEQVDQVTVVALEGEMTADDVTPFRKLADDRFAEQGRDFVLDLSKLQFIDSQGLETLLWLQDATGERLGQVRLVQPHENIRQILRITRLDRCFDAHDDTEAALKSLR